MKTIEVICEQDEMLALFTSNLPDGISVEALSAIKKSTDEITPIASLAFNIATSVATGVFANWIYETLNRKNPKQITINRTEIEFTRGEIQRVVIENLEIDEKK